MGLGYIQIGARVSWKAFGYILCKEHIDDMDKKLGFACTPNKPELGLLTYHNIWVSHSRDKGQNAIYSVSPVDDLYDTNKLSNLSLNERIH
jgi:hypothetical protein